MVVASLLEKGQGTAHIILLRNISNNPVSTVPKCRLHKYLMLSIPKGQIYMFSIVNLLHLWIFGLYLAPPTNLFTVLSYPILSLDIVVLVI